MNAGICNQYLEGMSNLLKRASLDPEGISKLLEELKKKNNVKEEKVVAYFGCNRCNRCNKVGNQCQWMYSYTR